MKAYVLYVFVLVSGFARVTRASFIKPCKAEDTVCLKDSAAQALPVLAAGIPDFNIGIMDPMLVEQVKTSEAGLDMDFRNSTVKGLKHCIVLSLRRQGQRTYLDLKCSVNMIGDYTLGGKLLMMPIDGSGRYQIKIRDIVVKIMFQVGVKTVNGEKYWTVPNWKHSCDVETGVHFQFNNLFKGNNQLADAIHQFANQNWREIFQTVAPPIVKAIVAQILQQVTRLFDHVPLRELVVE